MEIEYKLTQEDLLALQRHIRRSKPKSLRNQLVSAAVWTVIVLGALLLVNIKDVVRIPLVDDLVLLLPGVGVGALLTLIGLVLYAKLIARNAIRKLLQTGRNAEKALGLRRLVIDAQGVHTGSKIFSSVYLWAGIDEVATTDAHVFLYFTTANAFIVPRHAFPSNRTFDDFVETARRYRDLAGAGEAVQVVMDDGTVWERRGATGIQAPDRSGKVGTAEGIIPKDTRPHHT